MTRKYFSQTNLDFRILDIQNTCKKITIHFGFVYYDWLRLIQDVSTTRRHPGLIYIWAGAPPLWAGPKWADPIGRRAGSV